MLNKVKIEGEDIREGSKLVTISKPKSDPFWGSNKTRFLCDRDVDTREVVEEAQKELDDEENPYGPSISDKLEVRGCKRAEIDPEETIYFEPLEDKVSLSRL